MTLRYFRLPARRPAGPPMFGLLVITLFALMTAAHAAPVDIILDTDMALDVDDAGTLGMLHALADNGEAHILAVMHSTGYAHSVGAIDAINTYYRRPDIPIGAYHGSYERNKAGKYAKPLSDAFPNDTQHHRNVPAATDLYRHILASRPNHSVTITVVGFLTNLELLLKSSGDSHSSLNGVDLVKRKVKHLVVMGGKLPSGKEFNLTRSGIGPTSKYVIEHWPTDMVFSTFDIGDAIKTGAKLKAAPADHPVREAYRLYFNGEFKNRRSWDQTAVLYAVRGLSNYWTTVTKGYNHINADGSNQWRSSPDKNHAYLVAKMSSQNMASIIDTLMLQRPRKKPTPARPTPPLDLRATPH